MKKILVIGKKSFVGDSFIEYISAEYQDEYEIDNVSSMGNEWEQVDFGQYDAVYNVAGLAHVKAKKSMEAMYFEINRDLPVKMCKKAKTDGCKLFVHMSSMIVYGGMSRVGERKNIGKETSPNPENFYGTSKLQADELLLQLSNQEFHVAIMRPPLIYSHNARDNFPRLIKFAQRSPVFPNISNKQSMIYVYNLAELIRLVIDNWGGGIYYPQNREYTNTSMMVKKFADEFGNKMIVTRVFNIPLRVFSLFVPFINKAFGDLCYDKEMSAYFDWAYCKYTLDESIERTAKLVNEKKK